MRYFLVSLIVLLSACQKDKDVTEKSMKDVAYGSADAQKMDIYLPAGRSTASTRVIVLIHGGAWSSGDKADFDVYVDSLKMRLPDYAVFNVNYRLSLNGNNVFPAQENDIKAAMDFIYERRGEFGISDKVVLLGASAGAHLALLQGYKYNSPVKVKAIVDFFGPADLVALYNYPASPLIPASMVAGIIGGTPTTNPAIYQSSSPVNFITPSSPPTIILQGGTDFLVSPSQSTALRDKLLQKGVTHQYVYYPSEGHGWVGANLSDSFDKIQAFLFANVN